MSKTKLIPAVGYLRKSTKFQTTDRHGNRGVSQEKSLSAQKADIERLAKDRYKILAWFEDEGISGLKRGAQRPEFTRMIHQAANLGAHAILCDHIDRFSRASIQDVQEDVLGLRKSGIRLIDTVSHGAYDLGHQNDIAEAIKFVVAVWSAHEYSRQLSRRVMRAMRDRAATNKRTGGPAPLGYENDDQGGLKRGSDEAVELVNWIYCQFAQEKRSPYAIAKDLNAQGIKTRLDKQWCWKTVVDILKNPVYGGTFVWGEQTASPFYRLDADGKIIPVDQADGEPGKIFTAEHVHELIVSPDLFRKATERLMSRSNESRFSKKNAGFALTGGVLRCGYCNGPMSGMRRKGLVYYRCSRNPNYGDCHSYEVKESLVLPAILAELGQEVKRIDDLLSKPPDELDKLERERASWLAQKKQERERLEKDIATTTRNLARADDDETFKDLASLIKEWRSALDQVNREIEAREQSSEIEARELALEDLRQWWKDFLAVASFYPRPEDQVPQDLKTAAQLMEAEGDPRDFQFVETGADNIHLFHDGSGLDVDINGATWEEISRFWYKADAPEGQRFGVMVDPLKLNDALRQIGCEATVYWEPVPWGKRTVHKPHKLVFRIGMHREGSLIISGPADLHRFSKYQATSPREIKLAV